MLEASLDPSKRGPDWTHISPVAGSLFHEKRHRARYAMRKQIPEPVFGIIKSALGFRQFSLRGLNGARGEWSLVTMAWNIKRIFSLAPA